ncbi:TPA: hypothetical protein EYP37_04340 [Candidatus Poribacteria bacterium]|nr:hypothetical protein [Candidatus Poribacteria bacterium]
MDLWDMAREKREVLTFSTLFTAQNVRDYLSSDEGIAQAIDWCRRTAVTKVYIESFRNGYTAERKTLERARDRFKGAGFEVAGCVTTTNLGKRSTGWSIIACYTDKETQERLQRIFEYTASMFDLIMIDDFLFTDCQCQECQLAKGDRSWAQYRCDLMTRISRERIIEPAKSVNPKARIIIKYPQWYDNFHNRGYDVVRETEVFDYIWVGTETRDPDNERWGRKAQYEAYYIMRWLGEIGGEKTGGGWFDPFGTSPPTYLEQARQTVLADAREVLLFCYGALQRDTGPANIQHLRREIPYLYDLADIVRGEPILGISAPKPPNSDPGNEPYVFDFVGMLGLPLVPTAGIEPEASDALFLSYHALKDEDLKDKLLSTLDSGKPVMLTDGLVGELEGVDPKVDNAVILNVGGEPRSLLNLGFEDLRGIRDIMLKPFSLKFDAPSRVSLYLFGEGYLAIESFNEEKVEIVLTGDRIGDSELVLILPMTATAEMRFSSRSLRAILPPRSLTVLRRG